jgi:hypothetical protein
MTQLRRQRGWSVCARNGREQPQQTLSLNHPVGSSKQRRRKGDTQSFGCFEIDEKLELCDLLNRKIPGLFTLDNAPGVDPSMTVAIPDNYRRSSSDHQRP